MTDDQTYVDDLFTRKDERPEVQQLLSNLKQHLPVLRELLEECNGYWGEDGIYRFYHGSFKVYGLQNLTEKTVTLLSQMGPKRELNQYFTRILRQGTGLTFSKEHNKRWLEITRPIVEAFFHARFFLEMAVKYAQELDDPPCCMPSGWAALLYLYDIR